MKLEGAYGYIPRIEKLGFSKNEMIDLFLNDGRIISFPKSFFSDIEKLTSRQLNKWTILHCGDEGDGFMFDDCGEVYHIEKVLGKHEEYRHNHSVLNEPQEKYHTKK